MSKIKIKIGILCGGQSAEHEVSVQSALSVLEVIDKDRYETSLIGITHQGQWSLVDNTAKISTFRSVSDQCLSPVILDYSVIKQSLKSNKSGRVAQSIATLEVIFPLLHGPYGEDGTVQGLFELANLAYVGCGVAASAIAMDKVLSKQMFAAAGLDQTDFASYKYSQWQMNQASVLEKIQAQFEFPVFIKPANMGSSIGITKAHDRNELISGIEMAFQYDLKIIVEASAEGFHEVECAILGNETPQASVVGEILPGKTFYDYETKYIDSKTKLLIPATISSAASKRVQEDAIKAFKAIDGSGLARVDFFVSQDNQRVYINEINTMPGFTSISMYPKMWQASGLDYPDLINNLIDLALEKHKLKQRLKNII